MPKLPSYCSPAAVAVAIPATIKGESSKSRIATVRALLALTKPRLAFFTILSAMVGYVCTRPSVPIGLSLWTLAGITLSAGGALSLNQWWERALDARMRRTCGRPLPGGELAPSVALFWSVSLSLAGVVLLALLVNLRGAMLAALIIGLYGFVYTPLKRRSQWATEVGSVSGALPPLLGAAAAGEIASAPAWVLAGILLFWQMPHFYGIGWMYRADYRAAGFRLLPAVDPGGVATARRGYYYTLGLVVVSLVPWALGVLGPLYGITALVGGVFMTLRAGQFLRERKQNVQLPGPDLAARKLFLATVIYLPPVMLAMVLDTWLR